MDKKITVMTLLITGATYTLTSSLHAAYHGTWPPCAVMTAEGDAVAMSKGQVVTGMICRSGPFAPDRFQRLEASIEAVQNSANEALTAAQTAQDKANSASSSAIDTDTKSDRAQQTADEALNTAAECCAKAERMFEKIMHK